MQISGSRDRAVARLVMSVAALLLLAVGAVVGWAVLRDHPHDGTTPAAPRAVVAPEAGRVSVARAVSSLAILRDWDRSRAAAWREGDAAALRGLYLPASEAGEQDVAMLERWQERGLRVRGMQMQVLAVELRARTDRQVVLLVTDRLVGAEAVRASSGSPSGLALPRDQPTTRELVFRRVGGRWLLASAVESAQASPVASTAPTSGSSN